ncbi:MAG: hypothetical protein WA001_04280 [Patescibacteria group bacterium]
MMKLFHFRWVADGESTLKSYDVDQEGRLTSERIFDGRAVIGVPKYPCLLKNGEIFSRDLATLQATPPLELMGQMGLHSDWHRKQIDLWTTDEALALAMKEAFGIIERSSYDDGHQAARKQLAEAYKKVTDARDELHTLLGVKG